MMKSIFKITLLLISMSLTTQAQKTKNVQEGSVFAPKNLKIDGKDTEWNNTFKANNKRTGILYTIANDEKNLYLVIKSANEGSLGKILSGGITLSVNPDGQKKIKESITLTYPYIPPPSIKGGMSGVTGRMASVGSFSMSSAGPAPKELSNKEMDSLMSLMNKKHLATMKEVKISGFKLLKDTLISIYNENNIKTFATIGKDNAFFYELSIPLTELGLSIDNPGFVYNIRLNGLQIPGGGPEGVGLTMAVTSTAQVSGSGTGNALSFEDMASATDFWGKYTLAKK